MPETPPKEPSRFRINVSPDRLRRLLQSREHREHRGQRLFPEVSRHSYDYQEALGLNEKEIGLMEDAQGRLGMFPSPEDLAQAALVQLEIDGKQFGVVAKHTACHDYGDFDAAEAWKGLLMAISGDPSLNQSAGDGTSWINAVPDDWHTKILKAIRSSAQGDDLSAELFRRPK